MMSKKQWFVLLCLFIIYLLLGAGIFFNIETQEEDKRLDQQKKERWHVEVLLNEIINKTTTVTKEREFFKNLSAYCGKPISYGMKDLSDDRKWDFYHSLFFVITVVSTIGYGNLAPTTMLGRIFMIFYGLIGIPMNGIIMVTLGNYFGKSFTKLYRRWKSTKTKEDTTRLGLISQVVLYLVPGFTFFIFLPSGIMVLFEGWEYDVAVYYCFVTLTTIGFGDYVAGVENANHFTHFSFWVYKIFLLIWVIGGLGYVVMILGYITQAMQSKKMQEIEHRIAQNIKKTPVRIRQELRALLQEFLYVKRAYKTEFVYTPAALERSQSCPDLRLFSESAPVKARQRAFSECPQAFMFQPVQSDADLEQSEENSRPYKLSSALVEPSELLMKVLDSLRPLDDEEGGYHGLSDSQILASERFGSRLSLRSQHLAIPEPSLTVPDIRRRAVSDVRVPTMVRMHPDPFGEDRTSSEPSSEQNFLTKIKNKFISQHKDDRLDSMEKQHGRRQSLFSPAEDRYLRRTSRGRPSIMSLEEQEAVLEQTSMADFLWALSEVAKPENLENLLPAATPPRRKTGNVNVSPPQVASPPRTRRQAIRPNVRRTSLMPESPYVPHGGLERRRLSLLPVEENFLAPPPPYTPRTVEVDKPTSSRKFSKVNVPIISISPVERQINKRENKDEGGSSGA